MKKVNLDVEFNKWRGEKEPSLQSEFCHLKEKEFDNFVEECWRTHQDENGL